MENFNFDFNFGFAATTVKEAFAAPTVAFTDKKAYEYGLFLAKDNNKDVGSVTNASDAFAGLLNMASRDKEKFVVLFKEAIYRALVLECNDKDIAANREARLGKGTKAYTGLLIQTLDNVYFVQVDNVRYEDILINEALDMEFNFENCFKFCLDINSVYRGYQEMTIDAAKKLYVITYNLFVEHYRSLSTLHLFPTNEGSNVFKNFNDGLLSISRKMGQDFVHKLPCVIGQRIKYTNGRGDDKLAAVDVMGNIQNVVANAFQTKINTDLFEASKTVKLPEDQIKDFEFFSGNKIYEDIYTYVKAPYGNAFRRKIELEEAVDNKKIGNFRKELEKNDIRVQVEAELERISNVARTLLRNVDLAVAGKMLYALSHVEAQRNGNNKTKLINPESTGTMFMNVAPEAFLQYVASLEGSNGEGSKIFGDEEVLAGLVGQEVEFEFGNNFETGIYSEELIEGKFNIMQIDGQYYASKKIVIDRVAGAKVVNVKMIHDTKNADGRHSAIIKACAAVGFDASNKNSVLKAIHHAAKVELHKEYTTEFGTVKNAVVVTSAKSGLTLPVARFIAGSREFQEIFVGMNNMVRVLSADGEIGRGFWVEFDATQYDEVIREQLNVVEEDPFADIESMAIDFFAGRKETAQDNSDAFGAKSEAANESIVGGNAFESNEEPIDTSFEAFM